MDLQAVTGQLYIVEGEIQDVGEVPGLLAQAPPARVARGRSRDSLFVQLSLSGPPAQTAELSQSLLRTISKQFYKTSGSVTAALRDAILEANKQLVQRNMSNSGPAYEGGLVCAVLRGNEMFMVQTGSAVTLIGRNFGMERLPARPPERVTPLGRSRGLDLRYFHNWLEQGDMLLLGNPELAALPGDQLKTLLVDSTVEESIPALAELVGDKNAQVLLLEFTDEVPLGLPERVATRPAAVATTPATRTLEPPTRAPRREGDAQPNGEQPTRALKRPAIRPKPEDGQVVTPPAGQATREWKRPSLEGKVALPEIDLPSATEVEDGARRVTSQTAFGLARAVGWLANLLERLRPQPAEEEEAPPGGWLLPALVAILVPLVVVAIVVGVYAQRGRVTRMSEIRQEMQQSLVLADQAATDIDARTYYNQALALATEADELRPNDGEVARMRRQALAALDRSEDITRLVAQPLYRYEEGTNINGVTLREGFNGDIFVLDGANNRVFVHDTEEDYTTLVDAEPTELLFGGKAVGNHIVGSLIDMIWRPSGTQVSSDGLAVLDGRGALISYHPTFGTLRAVPLGLASEWVRPQAVALFNERLYVLDVGAGEVWRYFPESDGFFVDEDQRALSLPDLDQAVDIAIHSEDGSVLVLYADGRLRRYGRDSLLWDESNLTNTGLESPLVAPTQLKIVGSGLNSSVFIADPGSARLVQVSLGGSFLAQYKVTDAETGDELLDQMGDFEVSEPPLRVFIGAGNGLYVATQE